MENRTYFYEKGISANRNILAILVIVLTIAGIFLISYFYYSSSLDQKNISSEKIFNSLLPLFATWVGTVLAFYFGRENFEAASNRYEEIINKLSPELLDDIFVNQIMITKKTMVSIELEKANEKTVNQLIDFLESIDKSRLPILEDGKAVYVIHRSTFLEAKNKEGASEEIKFDEFINNYKTIIKSYIQVNSNEILENVIKEIKDKPNIKDVFIIGEDRKVQGWLTDTLIMRYIKS